MNHRRGNSQRLSAPWLGYQALCEANRPAYVQYAEQRIADRAEARQCVDAVLEAVKGRWITVLGSQCPAARIWADLRTEAARRTPGAASRAGRLHAILRPAEADMVILHHHVGLPVERAAHLMGMANPIAHALLRGAERGLDPQFDG